MAWGSGLGMDINSWPLLKLPSHIPTPYPFPRFTFPGHCGASGLSSGSLPVRSRWSLTGLQVLG